MAQGLKKVGGGGGNGAKRKKSNPAKKRQVVKKVTKGRKNFEAKGRKIAMAKQNQATSKAISQKNEMLAASRALTAGNTFFLKDLKEKGKKELNRQGRNLQKKEHKRMNLSDKFKEQLQKIENGG